MENTKLNDPPKVKLNYCRILQTALERVSADNGDDGGDGDYTYTLTATVAVSPIDDGEFTINFTIVEDGESTNISVPQDFDMNSGDETICDVEISNISLSTFTAGKSYTVISDIFNDDTADVTASADINTTVYTNPQSSYNTGLINFTHDKINSGEKYMIKPKTGSVLVYTDIYSSGSRFGRGFSVEIPEDDDIYELTATPYNIKKQSETSFSPKEQISLANPLTTEIITASPEIAGITKPVAGKIGITFKLPDFYSNPKENYKSLIAFGQKDEVFEDYSGLTACDITDPPAKTDEATLADTLADTLYYSEITMPALPETFGGNYLYLFIKTAAGDFIYAGGGTKNTVCVEDIIVKTDWTFNNGKAELTTVLSYNCNEPHTFEFDKNISVDDLYNFYQSGEKLSVTPKFKDKSGFVKTGFVKTCDGFERGYYPNNGTLVHLNTASETSGNTVYTFKETKLWYTVTTADISVQIAGKITVVYDKDSRTTTVTVVNPAAITASDFEAFLSDLTNSEKANVTPLGYYKLREIVSRAAAYVPASHGDFIALGIDKDKILSGSDGYCSAELLPGFILGVQASDLIYQPEASLKLIQGFTPSYRTDYLITAESDENGLVTLVLDKNLRKTIKFWGADNSNKTVLGGDLDFFKSNALKSYAKITAPKTVLDSDVITSKQIAMENFMSILFSDDYAELISDIKGESVPTETFAFRMRAAVTTNIRAEFCSKTLTVPAGTSLSDIAQMNGINESGLNTLRFYRRDAEGILCRVFADLTQFTGLQLMPGDVIKYE
jgi:hypothetical protein